MINLLEPRELLGLFRRRPPLGFAVVAGDKGITGFCMKFGLGTTLDPALKRWLGWFIKLLPRPYTFFVGTTATEYAVFPAGATAQESSEWIISQTGKLGATITVVKDIPDASPLLSPGENLWTRGLRSRLEEKGFDAISGEALAFVPIQFSSLEEFLRRFSKSRRRNFRRKMKARSQVRVQEIPIGSGFFTASATRALYRLYKNTYAQSDIHFDCLSEEFFQELFTAPNIPGKVFLYEHEGRWAAFNLCLETDSLLIDKYIGFDYSISSDLNLYFLSWFYNLEYCLRTGKKTYVAGWTDPAVKAQLGASFTTTIHLVRFRYRWMRLLFRLCRRLFEADRNELGRLRVNSEELRGCPDLSGREGPDRSPCSSRNHRAT